MGALTKTQIVAEALRQVGNTGLTSRANAWLDSWLRSQYTAWPWPFLQKRATAIPLAAGTQSLSVGKGAGGITLEIQRVLDPVWLYSTGYTSRRQIRIRSLHGGHLDQDETVNNPATNRGMPAFAKVRADGYGAWNLVFDKVPDKNYLLAIDYIELPIDVAVGDIPVYPNDRTMIKAVAVEAMKFLKHEDRMVEMDVLAAMTVDDRIKFGEVLGTNDYTGLDPNVFR